MEKLCFLSNLSSSEWAAWVQAIFSIVAIAAGFVVVVVQSRNARRLLDVQHIQNHVTQAETLTAICDATLKHVQFTIAEMATVAAVNRIASGHQYFDHVTFRTISKPLEAVPLHELGDSTLVRTTLAYTSNATQFKANVEKAIAQGGVMDAVAHGRFTATLAQIEGSCVAMQISLNARVLELKAELAPGR